MRERGSLAPGDIVRTRSGGGRATESTRDGDPIHPITRFTKRIEEAPFQSFIDYNTGERYAGGSQLYWKSLSSMMREYLDHPESKFHNGAQTGKMKRRHLYIQKKDQIHYIGKEADQIEQTEILGADDETYVEYRKAETRFDVLSNPSGSVAASRITNREKELEDARDGIADMTNDTDELRREDEDQQERLAKLEQKRAPRLALSSFQHLMQPSGSSPLFFPSFGATELIAVPEPSCLV